MPNTDYQLYRAQKDGGAFSSYWAIYNEGGQQIYQIIRGGCMSPVTFQLVDMNNQELLNVSYSFWGGGYTLQQQDVVLAKMAKRLALFKNEIVVSTNTTEDIVIKGNWTSKEFRFFKGDEEFAYVNRQSTFFERDKYAIAIEQSVNPILILGIIMSMQHMLEQQKGQ